MVLGRADVADMGRQRGDVHSPGGTEDVDTGRHREPARGGLLGPRIARRDRLHREGSAEVRQREGHGPAAADRARHDLVGTGRFERVADGHGVGIDLEAPEARAHLVQEVDALPFVGHHTRRAVARNATQCCQVRGRRARRSGVQERVARDQLPQVAVVGDVEVAEPRVLGVAAVGAQPGQTVHRFGGDDGAHRLAWRVDQVQVVGLPAKVARGGLEHVVGEHGGELRAHRAERPRHGRIHVPGAQVGAVELVDDARHAAQLRAQHVGKGVDRAEVVPCQLVAGVQARRVPAEGHALRPATPDRRGDPEVLAHVVEDELPAPCAAHRVGEGVDVADRALEVLGVMPGLVHELDEEDGRLVLEGHTRVGIHVIQDLAQVVHLRRDGGPVGAHAGLAEASAESRGQRGAILERVRPVRAVELDRAEQHVDAALARAGDEVVQEVEMVVGDQIAGRVGGFPIAPEGQPEAVPAHAGEVGHVLIDHLLAIGM